MPVKTDPKGHRERPCLLYFRVGLYLDFFPFLATVHKKHVCARAQVCMESRGRGLNQVLLSALISGLVYPEYCGQKQTQPLFPPHPYLPL